MKFPSAASVPQSQRRRHHCQLLRPDNPKAGPHSRSHSVADFVSRSRASVMPRKGTSQCCLEDRGMPLVNRPHIHHRPHPAHSTGQWVLLARCTREAGSDEGIWKNDSTAWALNEADPSAKQYSCLHRLGEFAAGSGENAGEIQLKLCWPGQSDQVSMQEGAPTAVAAALCPLPVCPSATHTW